MSTEEKVEFIEENVEFEGQEGGRPCNCFGFNSVPVGAKQKDKFTQIKEVEDEKGFVPGEGNKTVTVGGYRPRMIDKLPKVTESKAPHLGFIPDKEIGHEEKVDSAVDTVGVGFDRVTGAGPHISGQFCPLNAGKASE